MVFPWQLTDALWSVFLLFLCYGVAITPSMYVYSFLFASATTAYVMLFCLNFFSGLLLLLINAIITVEAVNDDSVDPVSALVGESS